MVVIYEAADEKSAVRVSSVGKNDNREIEI